jgi:hypothetical protein
MKKTPQKLVLRTETLRALANIDLARAIGGFDSGVQQCPAVLDTGQVNCATGAAAVATAACR